MKLKEKDTFRLSHIYKNWRKISWKLKVKKILPQKMTLSIYVLVPTLSFMNLLCKFNVETSHKLFVNKNEIPRKKLAINLQSQCNMSNATTNKKVFPDTKKGRRIKTKEFPNGFCHLNPLIFVSKWTVAKLWQKSLAKIQVRNYCFFWKIVGNISKEVKPLNFRNRKVFWRKRLCF